MAYDDESLKIKDWTYGFPDTYKRHEGVLSVMPSGFIGAEEYLEHSPVDFFEDLVICFREFKKQFYLAVEEPGASFNPIYTGEDWVKLCNLAIHETVTIPKRFIDIKFNFDEFKKWVIIFRQHNAVYIADTDSEYYFKNFDQLRTANINIEKKIKICEVLFSKEILNRLKEKCSYLSKIDKIPGINPKLRKDILSFKYYLDENDWKSFYENIGLRKMSVLLNSDLMEEWFDESYIYETGVVIKSLGLTLFYEYETNKINIHWQHPFKFISSHNFDNLDLSITNYYDLDEIVFKLSESLEAYFLNLNYIPESKSAIRLVDSNWEVIKKAISKLLSLNYTKPPIVNDDCKTSSYTYEIGTRNIYFLDEFTEIEFLNLKEFDIRSPYIGSLAMQCKIKNLKSPTLQKKDASYVNRNDYTQTCIVYEDNTNKTLKALLLNSCADFDKWDNVTDVKIFATWDLREKRPLLIREMNPIENSTIETTISNRNDETPGYNNWRDAVIKRDKICQCCGFDKNLEAHHSFGYKEYPELATDINNGIVLCKHCHDKYHSIYGLKNINPRDLVEFIKKFGVK